VLQFSGKRLMQRTPIVIGICIYLYQTKILNMGITRFTVLETLIASRVSKS